MLVVDRHALRAVNRLHFVDQVLLSTADTENAQNFLRIRRTVRELLSDFDVITIGDQQTQTLADRVFERLRTVIWRHYELACLVRIVDRDATGRLGDRRLALGLACFEELHDARQTVRDVVAGHTTGVEGTHRELRSGFTDRLCGDRANGFANVDELAGGQRAAVALGARAGVRFTREDRADLDRVDAGFDQTSDLDVAEVTSGRNQHFAGVWGRDVGRSAARICRGFDILCRHETTVVEARRDDLRKATLGATIFFADDDVLAHVHQTAGQITRVCCTQSRVGESLTGAVSGDEVFDNRQAFTEVRLDRSRNDFTLGVGHKTAHGGDLADLHHVSAGTGMDHHPDRVVLGEGLLHFGGDLSRGLSPDFDELLTTLVLGDETAIELDLDLGGLGLVGREDLRLTKRLDNVVDRNRDARVGCPVETSVLEGVERIGHIDLGVALGQIVDDDTQLLFADLVVDVGVVLGQRLVEDRATQCRVQRRALDAQLDLGLESDLLAVERHDRFSDRSESTPFTQVT